jgi:hypothetical protein
MDRRYSGMRFYDGTRASTRGSEAADRLVRSYMTQINKTRRAAENYGGSTGGIKSLDGRAGGLKQIQTRQARQGDVRRIFKEEGSGRYGARKESFIGRMTDPGSQEREVAIRKQKGMSDDEEFTST